jgi:transcriptional regulator with XRE-family HTH domain
MVDGAKLKHWRLANTMTVRDLAARSGVNHSAISEIERGLRAPHPTTIRKLAEALGIAPADLLEDVETGKAAPVAA